MTTGLISRQKEQKRLLELFHSQNAEFLALYGRRRVGKTVLVRETLTYTEGLYFELTGQKQANLSQQLTNFSKAYQKTFYPKLKIVPPKTWAEAFEMLTQAVNSTNKKVTIFLDELPWLATKRSNLISALDYIWNTEWVKCPQIKLIVCGSAASWMITHIISDKGGLHNRTTDTMLLKPLTLSETKEFLEQRHITLDLIQILRIYMTMGGIPYYLNAIKPGKSSTETINTLCFQESGLLFNEFDKLFDSLFDDADIYKELITVIANKRYGAEKNYILKHTKLSSSGGRFNKRLNELVEAGFVKKILQEENKKATEYYRIIDEYSYFYLKWILPIKNQLFVESTNTYWQLQSQTSAWKSWAGYTFETICLKHVNKIIRELDLTSLVVGAVPWRYIPEQNNTSDTGAQIDLILKRNDHSITLCEIKFNLNEITIDKTLRANLLNKAEIYQKVMQTNEHIFIVMITCKGVKDNNYAKETLANQLTIKDLF